MRALSAGRCQLYELIERCLSYFLFLKISRRLGFEAGLWRFLYRLKKLILVGCFVVSVLIGSCTAASSQQILISSVHVSCYFIGAAHYSEWLLIITLVIKMGLGFGVTQALDANVIRHCRGTASFFSQVILVKWPHWQVLPNICQASLKLFIAAQLSICWCRFALSVFLFGIKRKIHRLDVAVLIRCLVSSHVHKLVTAAPRDKIEFLLYAKVRFIVVGGNLEDVMI